MHPLILNIRDRISKSDIGRRMATGAFWSFTGTVAAKIIVLIGGILCAHVLGKEEYGEFGMVRSTINMFVVLGSAGLGLTATKYISEYRTTDVEHISSIYVLTNGFAVITGLIVSFLICLFSSYLAEANLHSPHLTNSIRLGALLLFVTVVNAAQNGTLAGFERFKDIAVNNFIGSVFETTGMLLGASYYGVEGAVIGFGTGYIALFVANYFSINRQMKSHSLTTGLNKLRRSDFHLLYKFSLPAVLSSMMVAPVMWIVRSMLVRHDGFGELAVYEVADQWKIMILFIPGTISQIVLPILSSLSASDTNRFWKVLKLNLMINASIALCIAICVCAASPFIIRFYGAEFDDPWPLAILALSTIFSSVASEIGLSICSRAKMWTGFSFNLFWAMMVLTLSNYFLQRNYGATGLALALLIAYTLHSIIQYIYLRTVVKDNSYSN